MSAKRGDRSEQRGASERRGLGEVRGPGDSPDGDALLDELVMLCIARIEEEGLPAVEALCREHPEQADGLRARVASLVESGMLEPDEALGTPKRLGDFVLGRRLGGGGMGVVHAAVQESLGREVALKIVRADQLYFPGSRERFRREGRLVARLSHAGIVPVHGVGEQDGVPYLAMELLRGATLAEVLATLGRPPRRGRDLAEAVARVVEARDGERVEVHGPIYAEDGVDAVLRIARSIAGALAHAHERGVLHRDLKASNVMLTVDGRALLFDFGLAHALDADRLTRSGARVGSLPYMAPEQVRGDAVDERTDVYGLGALLCEALTLRPPHEGPPDAVAAAIVRGEPVSLRSRRQGLSRDVETIVRTALEPVAARRYAAAADLERDLGHVLARRPIEARAAGPFVRLLRWTQRHPARAALLVVAVAAPASFAVQQAVAARRVAEQAERAEDNFDHAVDVLDPIMRVVQNGMLDEALHIDAERIALLQDVLAALEPLLDQRPDDPHLACRAVNLQALLGTALQDSGRLDESEATFRHALEVAARYGVEPAETASALNGLGNLLERRGDLEQACAALEEASARFGSPQSQGQYVDKSSIERNVSRLRASLGRSAESAEAADSAAEWAQRAIELAASPNELFEARYALGAAWACRAAPGGSMMVVLGEPLRALEPAQQQAFARALPLLLELADERPQHAEVAAVTVSLCTNAQWYLDGGSAEAVMLGGRRIARRLIRDHPDRLDLGMAAIQLEVNLYGLLLERGRADEALEGLQATIVEAEQWLAASPDDPVVLSAVEHVLGGLAGAFVDLERFAEAVEPARRARELCERIEQIAPGQRDLTLEIAWTRVKEGYGRVALGELDVARRLADELAEFAHVDPTIAVASGEILAGCALGERDVERARSLASQALDRLELGLRLGFGRLDYLAEAREWDGLRGDPRFAALLAAAAASAP